jgi:gliding motility-associated-like protein
MVRYLIVLFLILVTNFSFSQRTVTLTQTQNDAIKGIDRKAWAPGGIGNTGPLSDGYANDFTLPARINPCEKITNVKVDVIFSGYTKVGPCPHLNTYFNIFYGCTTYTGGATCPMANVISELPYAVNINPATRNFAMAGFFDFGGNLSVDIIAVSNPGCNPVTNGQITHQYTTTVTVTIAEDLPTTPTFLQVAPICSGGSLSALPTTSNNSISGTWTPALDNTATTTYTFTPTAGQCATSTTMTIVVNSLTLVITDPAPVCAPSTVNLTLPAVTAGSDSGTLTYWTDAAATIPLVNPNAVSVSNTYYIKNTVSGCFTIRPVVATIGLNTLSPPTVTTPVYLCQNSPSIPLTAAASAGSTLLWYTIPAGGIGSPTAPTPSTLTPGATTYYVSQTDGICESSRSAIVVNVVADNGATLLNFKCDSSQILPADKNSSVFFDWSNNVLINDNTYSFSYSIQGGPIVTGNTTVSHQQVFGMLPGQSATLTLTATRFPCVPAQTITCTVPCVTTTTPNFVPIAPFCTGTVAPILGPTSPNGISGTWSPAIINNTVSGSYVFTPDPILFPCALTQTLVVTIDPLVTPAFTTIPVFVCQGATAPILPSSSSNVTPIAGTWSPAIVDTSVLGSFPFTFTPNPGQCTSATPTTVAIRIDPVVLPTFAAVSPICSGAVLVALPTTSLNSITGTWLPALNNTATTTYTFTPTAGQCASTITLTITVNPNITPTFTAVPAICSGGVLSALPTTSLNSYTGTWAPVLNNTITTTYTFTPTAGQCATPTTMTIVVNPNIIPTFTQVPAICSGGVLAALPTTSLDSFTGTWAPALNNTTTTTYTFTPTVGQCATTTTMTITVNPNITPTFNPVPAICSGVVLSALPTTSLNSFTGTWAPALNNTATTTYTFTPTAGQCATSTTMTIIVNPNVTPTFTPVPSICSGAALAALPTTSLNFITGTWTPALNNTATTTYTFTPTAGQCATITTLSITVNPNILPTFTLVPAICSGGVLLALPTTSLNGYTGTWSPALNNTATTTYTFTPTAGQCATTTTMTITVNPNVTPLFNPVPAVCNGSIIAPLPTTSTNGITGAWLPVLNNSLTTLYTFTPTAGLCATTTTLTINVNPNIAPNFAPIPALCSGSTAPILATTSPNGVTGTWLPATISNTIGKNYVFTPTAGQCSSIQTLTVVITPKTITNFAAIPAFCSGTAAPILAPTSPNGVSGTWSPATISNTTSGSYLFTPNATECATNQTLNVVVNPLITPNFEDIPLCSGTAAPILPPTSPNGITGTWSPSTISNVASGAYVFTPNAPQCATTKTINVTVNPSNTLASISWNVTDAFSKNQVVTITATAAGNYLYQLDNGPFQTSPVFENVASGIHSITVIDANGCSTPITDNNVLVIGYPKYFTPNGDNINEFWNISTLSEQLNARIYIFDRYGKLLKDISPKDSGWDGTYIGQPMPADDYWFTVKYVEQGSIKEFKSHFSLKR